MIEFKTWKEDDDTTIIEAELRLTARTCIPNGDMLTLPYPHWVEKIAKKQLSYVIGRKLYGEITDKLLAINNKISRMEYSDSCTRADIIKELHKNINEMIHRYDDI